MGTLGNIIEKVKHHGLKPPAIVIIGEVAKLESRFNWLKRNKRVLFTGLSQERFFERTTYFHLPLIEIIALEDYREFDECLKKITEYDWIVFASRYGVEYFFKRLYHIGKDARELTQAQIAVIGNSTKSRLLRFGIYADLVPQKESSAGLIEEFRKLDLRGKRIFLPRSDISDKGLQSALESLGAEVTTSFAYRNVLPDNLPDLDLGFFDEIIFTSPSTVRNFIKRYKAIPAGVKVRCIGEVTFKEAQKSGVVSKT
jgi:uroporphyrinogen III methyltransferase/synthase